MRADKGRDEAAAAAAARIAPSIGPTDRPAATNGAARESPRAIKVGRLPQRRLSFRRQTDGRQFTLAAPVMHLKRRQWRRTGDDCRRFTGAL